MNRRSFLTALTGGVAGLALDLDMLGWVRRKSIFIPKPILPEPNHAFDIFTGTIGLCNGVPIPLSSVNLETMGPLFTDQGNVYRIVELREGHHVTWGSKTIYAVLGGKLQLLVKGSGPMGIRLES